MPAAAKHFDPMVGIDVHLIQPPGPAPPIPVPHPHTAMVMDPCDYAPYIGGTVKVGGLQRAQAGTGGISIPKHIPIGGMFVKPPENESELFMGSSTVAVDGDAFSYLGLPVLTCQCIGMPPIPRAKGSTPKSLVLPTTVCLSIPMPVSVGGGPTVSLMALGMRAGMAALGALAKKAKKAWKGRKGANGVKCNGAHPVDIVTGANFDDFCDAKEPAPRLLQWGRHYTTARIKERGPLGFAFRHTYQHTLTLSRQAWVYESPQGQRVPFDPLSAQRPVSRAQGHVLTRVGARGLEVRHRDDPTLVFECPPDTLRARLVAIRGESRRLVLEYTGDVLRRITEYGGEGTTAYQLEYDAHDRIVEVVRLPRPRRVAAYAYDKRGDLTTSVDAEGGQHSYTYDDHHRWVRMREPRGFEFAWRYGADGRCVEAWGQDGLWRAQFDYQPQQNRTSVTEREGGVHVFEYDDHGTLRTLVDPYGGTLVRHVDEADGSVVTEVDSGGRLTHWLYDANGGHTGRVDRFLHWFPPEEDLPKPPDPFESQPPASQREREYSVWRPAAFGVDLHDAVPSQHQALARWALDRPAPNGAASESHNALGRVVERIDDRGRSEHWKHDRSGNAIAYVDRDGREHRRTITSWNLAGAETDPLGNTSRYAYTSTEMLASVTDPGGNVSTYDYDQKDRIVAVHRHGRVRETYEWDEGDRLVAKRDGDGNTLAEYGYGPRSQLLKRTLTTGGEHHFGYDLAGNLLEASTDTDEILLHRDRDGRPRYDAREGGRVDHVYVGDRLRRTEFSRRFIVRYRDHGTGTTELTDPTGGLHRFVTDANGCVLREHPGSTHELSRYDEDGNCLGRMRWSGNEQRTVRYQYSNEGDLLEAYDTTDGQTQYEIDAAHRLVGENGPRGHVAYPLDEAGNLLGQPGLAAVTLTEGNRLTHAGTTRFTYDRRDRVCQQDSIRYRYDSLDQLVAVEDDAHDEAWTARYDAIGRRLRCGRGEAQTEFFWDHDRLAAEVAPDGRLRLYVYADEAALVPVLFVDYDSVDADPAAGRVFSVFTNQIGAPVAVVDAAGVTVWSARVEPYGATHVDPGATIDFNPRWPGHYADAETGLFYNRHRYYDPRLGRYLQPDPLGQGGDLNVYAYRPNPLVDVDLQGLHGKKGRANSAKAKDAERPKTNSGVKDGDVASYGELNRRSTVGDGIDHDHIPAYAAVRDAVNNQLSKQGKKKLTPKQKKQLKDNLTTMAMDHDQHKLSRSYKGKGGKARQATDASDLKQATKDDLDVGKKNLKDAGHDPKDVDDWGDAVDQRNEDIGLYDDPIPDDLWKTDMREQ